MMIYPELMLDLARDRQRELVAEADRGRVLRSARRRFATRQTSGSTNRVETPAVESKIRSASPSLSPAPRLGATVT